MADDDLITRYIDELSDALQERVRHADRVCAEIDDHLRSTAEELGASGLPDVDAQRRAIECFGPVDELAASFMMQERRGGGARASRFTTRSGLIGVIGGVLIGALAAAQAANGSHHDATTVPTAIGVAGFLIPVALTFVGFVGVVARHRGALRRTDLFALGLLATGLVVMWLPYWGILAIAVPLMIVGTVLFGVRVYRVHALPRPPLALMLLAGGWLIAMTVTKVDKSATEYSIAWALVLAAWTWLQFTLWSERPERRLRSA